MASFKSEIDVLDDKNVKIGTKNKYYHVPDEYFYFFTDFFNQFFKSAKFLNKNL
jgi:DNA-binding transcriptional regulator GbsR (MarR family)